MEEMNTKIDEVIFDEERIIDALKNQIGSKSDRQFAFAIGMRPDSYANAKKRGTFPYEKILRYCILNNISTSSLFSANAKILKSNNNIQNINNSSTFEYLLINPSVDLESLILPIPNGNNYKVFIEESNDIYIIDDNQKELKKSSKFIFEKNSFIFLRKYDYDFKSSKHILMTEEEEIDLALEDEEIISFKVLGRVINNYNFN